MKKLKINYFYDIIHPQSYVGFQLLKKSTSILSNHYDTTVEFLPLSKFGLIKFNKINLFEDLSENQRNLLNNEIENITRCYSLDHHNMNVNRNFAEPYNKVGLLFLTMIKNEHSDLYLKFIETFFKKTWESGLELNRGYMFFQICLECGLPFSVADDLVSRTETQINKDKIKLVLKSILAKNCINLPVIDFQFPEESDKQMTLDSLMKFVLLYDMIRKNPSNLEKIIEGYCK